MNRQAANLRAMIDGCQIRFKPVVLSAFARDAVELRQGCSDWRIILGTDSLRKSYVEPNGNLRVFRPGRVRESRLSFSGSRNVGVKCSC